MAAGVELATAYISILPELRGLRCSVNQEFRSIEGGSASLGSRSGKKMEQGFSSATKGRLGKNAYAGMDAQSASVGKRAGGRFSSEFMSAVKGTLAGIGTYLVIDKTTQFLKGSVTEASNLQQSVGGLEAVFKKSFGTMNKASQEAAMNLGLSKNEYNELATTLGSTLKNKGIDNFAGKTKNLITLGSDLSATYGGDTKDAVAALSSAMRGEMDPIERYGITMNQAMLEAEAYSSGIVKRTKDTEGIKAAQNNAIVAQRDYNEAVKKYGKNSDEALKAESKMIRTQSSLSKVMEGKKTQLTDQQKAQAALSLINKQSADAQGRFGKESNTLAGQQQRLNAQILNIQASLGKLLIPYLTKGATWVNNFLSEMQKGEGIGGKFKDALKGIYALVAKGDFTKEFARAFGVEEDSPIVDQILDIRDAVKEAFSGLKGTSGKDTLKGVFDGLGPTITAASKAIGFFAEHADKLGKVLPWLIGAFITYKALMAANNILGRDSAIGMGIQLFSTISLTLANRSLAKSMNAVTASQKSAMAAQKAAIATEKVGLITRVKTTLATIRQTVAEKARTVATKIGTVAQRIFNAVMAMNPLAKVILILTAVGTALVILYKKNETFRKFVNAAWQGIKDKIQAFSDWFNTNITPKLKAAWDAIGAGAKALWTKYISPAFTSIQGGSRRTFGFFTTWVLPVVKKVFGAIGATIRWLWSKVVKPYFGFMKAYWTTVFKFVREWVWPLVKTVFRAIGATVRWLWSKVVKPYFGFMKAYWTTVFKFVRDWVWPVVKSAFSKIGGAAKWLYTKFIKPYFGFVLSRIKSVAGWIKDKGWPAIKSAFNSIGDKAKWLWKTAKTPFDKLKSGVGAIKTAVSKAAGGIKTAWSKLNGYLRSPIKKALTWMNSKFIGGINKLLDTKILKIPKEWRIPTIKGFDTGGYTGKGGRLEPAGIVHKDEFVVKKPSRRKFERENPGALDHINRFGRLPGYSIGGKVQGLNKKFLQQLGEFNKAAGGRYSVYSGYRSIAHQRQLYARYLAGNGPVAAKPGSSQHNFGLAADLAPSNARDMHAGLARKFGLVFTVPSESWHIEPTWGRKGGDKGGSFWGGLSLPSWLENPAKWVSDKFGKITDGFKAKADQYGIAGKALPSVFSKMKTSVTNKVKDAVSELLPDFGKGGGGGNFSFTDVVGGTNKIIGKGLAKQLGWGSGRQWNALSELWRRESNWNHKATNPSSGAYGIPQSLPGSKMASAGSDWRTNAATQIKWGLNYIRERYGSPAAALAFHNRKNWYNDGGRVNSFIGKRPLEFDKGGYVPKGESLIVNNTGKPEPLKRMDLEEDTSGPAITVLVQNPWTGEYHEAKMQKVVEDHDDFKNSLGRMH